MNNVTQKDFQKILDLSKFCAEVESYRFPGMNYPWTVKGDDGEFYNVATNGICAVWIKAVLMVNPIDKVPDPSSYLREIFEVTEWSELKMGWPTCEACKDFSYAEFEFCECCRTVVLDRSLSVIKVNRITKFFKVEGVASVGENALAFKFDDGGFAYLMGTSRFNSPLI